MPRRPAPDPSKAAELLIQAVVDYGIYMLDAEGYVASWNPGAEQIKGYSQAEILGTHYSHFYTEEDRAEGAPERNLGIARDEGRFAGEGWRLRKDGTRFWAQVVIDPIRSKSGELIGFAKITRDMTERREAQERLLESERRFRLLVQGVTDYAIYMLDPTGVVTNWNSGAQRIKGYTADEIVGQHFSKFYAAEDAASGLPQRGLETARREGRFEAEGWRHRKDGSRFWASVVIDAIRDETGELIGFAKVTRDVTERRDTQERLEQSREQLFRAQKMEALGQLTGGLAHDFNNLLTAILGAADLALRNLDQPERVRRMLEAVRSSGRRGADLTRQLLAFARAQPLELKIMELPPFLAEAASLLRPSLRADIELITEVSDQVWRVRADPAQLELALMNLAFNARDAMKAGGTLRIAAHNVTLDGEPEGLSGDHVALTVSDTGPGMSPEVMERIFEPFYTTKAFGEGTGLGLAQVFGFAKQLGGAVTVHSAPGDGARFTLYVPAAKAGLVEAPRPQGGSRGEVLVVEDDEGVAELAAALLSDMGFAATVVHSAKDALEALGRSTPHAVFSDIVMPGGLSGLELAREIKRRHPELPILLTTGYSEQASSAHGFPVVSKPYEYEALQRGLEAVLGLQA